MHCHTFFRYSSDLVHLLQCRRIDVKRQALKTTGQSKFYEVDLGVCPGYLTQSTDYFMFS